MSDEFADPGEIWADKATYGWVRCATCGGEWELGEEPDCGCNE